MLPTTGHFKSISCPQSEERACQRPYCHFRHYKRGEEPNAEDNIVMLARDSIGVVREFVETNKKIWFLPLREDLFIKDLKRIPINPTYRPTPITELNKLKSNTSDTFEKRRKLSVIPYSPCKPGKRSRDKHSSEEIIYIPTSVSDSGLCSSEPIYVTGRFEQVRYVPRVVGPVEACSESTKRLKGNSPERYNLENTEYVPGAVTNLIKHKNKDSFALGVKGSADLATQLSDDLHSDQPSTSSGTVTLSVPELNDLSEIGDLTNEIELIEQILNDDIYDPDCNESNEKCDDINRSYQPTPLNEPKVPDVNNSTNYTPLPVNISNGNTESSVSYIPTPLGRTDTGLIKNQTETYTPRDVSETLKCDDKHSTEQKSLNYIPTPITISKDINKHHETFDSSEESSYTPTPITKTEKLNVSSLETSSILDVKETVTEIDDQCKQHNRNETKRHMDGIVEKYALPSVHKSSKESSHRDKHHSKKLKDKLKKSIILDMSHTRDLPKNPSNQNKDKSRHKDEHGSATDHNSSESGKHRSKKKHSDPSTSSRHRSDNRGNSRSKRQSHDRDKTKSRDNSKHHNKERNESSNRKDKRQNSKDKEHKETKPKKDRTNKQQKPEIDSKPSTSGFVFSKSYNEEFPSLDGYPSDDPDVIEQECMRIFYDETPAVKPPDATTCQVREPSPEQELAGAKRRVSRITDESHRPDIIVKRILQRPAPGEVAANRYRTAYEAHNKTSVESAVTVPAMSKVRIAHVPNVSGLLSAKKELDAMKSSIQKATISQTIPKGASRIAHIPNKELADLPDVIDVHSQKIPAHIRKNVFSQMVSCCLEMYQDVNAAYERAQKEEHACFDKCKTAIIYRRSTALTVHRLKQEALTPNDNPIASTSSASHLSEKHVHHFKHLQTDYQLYTTIILWKLSDDELKDYGYPRPIFNKKGFAAITPTIKTIGVCQSPFEKQCARCHKLFGVNAKGFPVRREECFYHPQRKFRIRGELRYTCCQSEDSTGCLSSDTHVWDYDDYDNLQGFVQTLQPNDPDANRDFGIFSLDCEMCYTTRGLELTRITVVDAACQVVYDTYVKPLNPIVDYNTRFSGITEQHMAVTSTNLVQVQANLLHMFNSKTILIGHSLESDFKALRLIHSTVVDTSILFPHSRGFPYKRALRSLASEYLNKIIQNNVSGHNSSEDAITCMELILHKAKVLPNL